MPKAHPNAANLSGTPDEIEAAFYEALQCADIEKLMACWSDEDDILCVHPSGPRVVGAVYADSLSGPIPTVAAWSNCTSLALASIESGAVRLFWLED